MCVMKAVGVRELRQNLSVYLRAIQEEGESIEVTDRGRPVAVLAPLKVGSDDYDALEAAGRLHPAQRSHPQRGPCSAQRGRPAPCLRAPFHF